MYDFIISVKNFYPLRFSDVLYSSVICFYYVSQCYWFTDLYINQYNSEYQEPLVINTILSYSIKLFIAKLKWRPGFSIRIFYIILE